MSSRIWGRHAVQEALREAGRVNRLYVAQDGKTRRLESLLDHAKSSGVPVEFVPLAKLNSLTGTGDHQGVAASLSPAEYIDIHSLIARLGSRACIVVLDEVHHPKNLGMVIRSAAAAGASGIVIPSRGGALVDESAVRASAGAVFHIPIARCNNVAQALRDLRDADFWVYGLDGAADQDIYGCVWPDRSVLVFGNESTGLRPAVRKACDALVRIPLHAGVESLNVSVAAGVVLYEIARQRAASDG